MAEWLTPQTLDLEVRGSSLASHCFLRQGTLLHFVVTNFTIWLETVGRVQAEL